MAKRLFILIFIFNSALFGGNSVSRGGSTLSEREPLIPEHEHEPESDEPEQKTTESGDKKEQCERRVMRPISEVRVSKEETLDKLVMLIPDAAEWKNMIFQEFKNLKTPRYLTLFDSYRSFSIWPEDIPCKDLSSIVETWQICIWKIKRAAGFWGNNNERKAFGEFTVEDILLNRFTLMSHGVYLFCTRDDSYTLFYIIFYINCFVQIHKKYPTRRNNIVVEHIQWILAVRILKGIEKASESFDKIYAQTRELFPEMLEKEALMKLLRWYSCRDISIIMKKTTPVH